MKQPTKTQMQTVIDTLTAVLPFAKQEDHLDMMHTAISGGFRNTKCGTVHCVAAWYGAKKYLVDGESIPDGYVGFTDGAKQMAKDMGFDDRYELESWARRNYAKWGNKYGYCMFSSKIAYGGAKNLKGVIKHLKGVQSRLGDK